MQDSAQCNSKWYTCVPVVLRCARATARYGYRRQVTSHDAVHRLKVHVGMVLGARVFTSFVIHVDVRAAGTADYSCMWLVLCSVGIWHI